MKLGEGETVGGEWAMGDMKKQIFRRGRGGGKNDDGNSHLPPTAGGVMEADG
jgi:hypothetical protein